MFATIMTAMTTLSNTSMSVIATTDNVSTGVGITTGNATLTETLLNGLVANVDSITSTEVGDVVVSDNYTHPLLYVTGLTANVTAGDGRTLTVTYQHEITSDYIALSTVIGIAPTVLLLAGLFGAAFVYRKGFKVAKAGDTSGMMRMVVGVLVTILFITLFATVVTAMNTLYTTYGSVTSWIAFGTVVSIAPTVLFLGGIFAGASTAVSGYRARRSRK